MPHHLPLLAGTPTQDLDLRKVIEEVTHVHGGGFSSRNASPGSINQ
jgi:hypothetical protein